MFKAIDNVLTEREIEELRAIASRATFVDGRVSAPGATVKNNMMVGERNLFDRAAQIAADALFRNEDFRMFAFPKAMSPPMLTRYGVGMYYGTHVDAAFMQQASRTLRSDLSCTIFLSDPESYEGGDLIIQLGSSEVRLSGPVGSAVVYPSTTLHRVEEVTSGERLVVLNFIESRIADSAKRELLCELFEIGAIAGEKMDVDTYTRLQRVQENLFREWGDPD